MKISRLVFFAVFSWLMAACSSHKHEMVYFTDIDSFPPVDLGSYSVNIEPGDELIITVTSENPQASANYNLPFANPATKDELLSTTSPRQQTYVVDPKGDIVFPMLGELKVEGLTVEELREKLTALISKDVENPLVTVDMVSYRINVIGEVASAGPKWVSTPRYTILDAIADAGDITQYGRRDNVLLIREQNGKRTHVRLDLTSPEIFSSPYYYLKQNDYIYVEPNDIRKDNSEYNQFNAFRLQVASVIVSSSATIVSLIIALSR